MFIKPPSSSAVHPSPLHSQSSISSPLTSSPPTPSYSGDPLLGGGGGTFPRVASPLHDSFSPLHANGHAGAGALHNPLDPLGQMQPVAMSASVRAPPQRPRLDAREAAKSLANMF